MRNGNQEGSYMTLPLTRGKVFTLRIATFMCNVHVSPFYKVSEEPGPKVLYMCGCISGEVKTSC